MMMEVMIVEVMMMMVEVVMVVVMMVEVMMVMDKELAKGISKSKSAKPNIKR